MPQASSVIQLPSESGVRISAYRLRSREADRHNESDESSPTLGCARHFLEYFEYNSQPHDAQHITCIQEFRMKLG